MSDELSERDQHVIHVVLNNGFRQPQPEVCIAGFPMTFRRVMLGDNTALWAPRGFSRHGKARAWRFKRNHTHGSISAYCSDQTDDPEESLKRLWVRACQKLAEVQCPTTSLTAPASSLRARDPLLDTGITGVSIQQRRCPFSGEFSIFIAVLQRLRAANGDHYSHYECIRNVSAKKFRQNPSSEQADFDEALVTAAMIRFEYNYWITVGARPSEPVTSEWISETTLAQRAWIASHIQPVSLRAIFDRERQAEPALPTPEDRQQLPTNTFSERVPANAIHD